MMICGRNNNSVDEKNAPTFFGKKNNKSKDKNKKNAVVVHKNNDISSPSSSSSTSSRSSTDNNEQQQEQEQHAQLILSPLSKMMSTFVVDSARKTHDSIENEDERKDFLVNLKEAMHNSPEYRSDVNVNNEQRSRRSRIDDSQQDQDDDNSHNKIKMMINRRSSAGVINFLVDTTQSTISFIEKEEEKNEFCNQLRSKFQDAFKSNPVVIESAE